MFVWAGFGFVILVWFLWLFLFFLDGVFLFLPQHLVVVFGRRASARADDGRWHDRGPRRSPAVLRVVLGWSSSAEAAAGTQVQASGFGLECSREFPVF